MSETGRNDLCPCGSGKKYKKCCINKMKNRILSEHFGKVKNKLLQYSSHFDIANHGDIKGFGREALVNEFLQTHLPDSIEYLTGEIIDELDQRSGQVDIILQSKLFPKVPLLGNTQLVFSDAVMAVIEVKSNLTTQHLNATLSQFRKIKGLKRQSIIEGRGHPTDLHHTPCIIFAFKGPSLKTLLENINKYAADHSIPLIEFAPDMVVILDSDYYLCRNDGWVFPVVRYQTGFFRNWEGLPSENLVGMYQYLFNLSLSYTHSPPFFNPGPYFDKAILNRP